MTCAQCQKNLEEAHEEPTVVTQDYCGNPLYICEACAEWVEV